MTFFSIIVNITAKKFVLNTPVLKRANRLCNALTYHTLIGLRSEDITRKAQLTGVGAVN